MADEKKTLTKSEIHKLPAIEVLRETGFEPLYNMIGIYKDLESGVYDVKDVEKVKFMINICGEVNRLIRPTMKSNEVRNVSENRILVIKTKEFPKSIEEELNAVIQLDEDGKPVKDKNGEDPETGTPLTV